MSDMALKLNRIREFRSLIILSSIAYFVLVILPYIDSGWLSEGELDVLSYTGYKALIAFPEFVLWVFVAIWYTGAIGLFFFRTWARLLFSVWVVVSAWLPLAGGMQVYTSVEVFLVSFMNIFDGAILAMVWFSSLREKFG